MMVAGRVNLPNSLALLALATTLGGLTSQAAEPDRAAPEPASHLDFSSGSSLDGLLPPSPQGENRRLLNPGSERSLQGLLRDDDGFIPTPPQTPSSIRPNRKGDPWSDRLSQEGSWLDIEFDAGGQPSAAAFRKAAGVRDYTLGSGEGLADNTAGSASPVADTSGTPTNPNTLTLGSDVEGLLANDSAALPTSGGSLDPILPPGLGLPFGSSRGNASSLAGTALDFDAARVPTLINSGLPQRGNALDLQGSQMNPIGTSEWIDNRAPRTVRELIQGSEAASAQRSREYLILDQDSTRMDLNPYVPGRREDFQFSRETLAGDSRLGIEARPNSGTTLASPSPVRSLSSQSSSSLSPAVALPWNNAPVPASRGFGQGNRYQFPSRRF